MLVCGCTSTLTKAGLDARATEHAGSSFPDRTYYVGSDGRYDHFVIRSGRGGPSHLYRVRESENAVTNRFTVTKDEADWRGYGVTDAIGTNGLELGPK